MNLNDEEVLELKREVEQVTSQVLSENTESIQN